MLNLSEKDKNGLTLFNGKRLIEKDVILKEKVVTIMKLKVENNYYYFLTQNLFGVTYLFTAT